MQDFPDRLIGSDAAGRDNRGRTFEYLAKKVEPGAQAVRDNIDDSLLK